MVVLVLLASNRKLNDGLIGRPSVWVEWSMLTRDRKCKALNYRGRNTLWMKRHRNEKKPIKMWWPPQLIRSRFPWRHAWGSEWTRCSRISCSWLALHGTSRRPEGERKLFKQNLRLTIAILLTSSSVNRSPMVVSSSRRRSSEMRPLLSSSKQPKAFLMTSSGSVPCKRSPNSVKNIVKLMGPGASFIISSRYLSVGFFPNEASMSWRSSFSMKPSWFWSIMLNASCKQQTERDT